MPPFLASIVFIIGIFGLFLFNRETDSRVSRAIWIPVMWLLIVGSRPVTSWFNMGPSMDDAQQYLDGSPLDRAVFLALLIAGLVVLSWRGSVVIKTLQSNLPIVLFFVYCLLSIVWSDFPFVAFKRWTKAIGDFVMVLIVITDPDQVAAIKVLLKRTAFLLIPWSVLLVKYYPDVARSYNPWNWEVAYTGVTANKNTLGMICLVFGTACLWRFLAIYGNKETPQRGKRLIAYGSVLLMVFWLLHIANSMTSLACFVLVGGIVVLTNLQVMQRTRILTHVLIAGVIGAAFFALFLDPSGTLIKGVGKDPTLTGRTDIWRSVLSVSASPLVGAGFESFWLGDRLEEIWKLVRDKSIQEAHNGYLEIYLNLGWVGISLLALILVTGYRNVMAMFRKDPEAGQIRIGFFVIAMVYGLTEAGFRMLAPVWIFLLFASAKIPAAPAEGPLPEGVVKPAKRTAQKTAEVGELVGARSRREAF